MITGTNQTEPERLKDIILAIIDYNIEKPGSMIKIDGRDPKEPRYQRLKQNAKKHFKKEKLELLQRMLERILEDPGNRVDAGLDDYIRKKTGYETNILECIQERTEAIIRQNRIKNQKEF